MIIDIHTHTFPPAIASRVMDKLSKSSNMHYYIEGTVDALRQSMQQYGIDYSVLMPIATNAGQYPTINRVAEEINARWQETGVLSFGSLHPDNDNYKEILRDLKDRGFTGIKLHPVFQEVYIDDPRFVRIIDYAAGLGFIILIHAGYDISFPGVDVASPQHIHNLLRQTVPDKLILAHMGGWGNWDYVEEHLLSYPIYLDSSFALIEPDPVNEWPDGISPWGDTPMAIGKEQFVRIVRTLGADRVFFGSDSPWSRQGDSIEAVRASGLTDEEIKLILGDNARRLLEIPA